MGAARDGHLRPGDSGGEGDGELPAGNGAEAEIFDWGVNIGLFFCIKYW